MADDEISFRWGIPVFEDKYTVFPNQFFRVYHQVVTKEEWLFICHLASYKYESEAAECRPSLVTIAREMCYKDVRSVRNLRASLEKKGLLSVESRDGKENIYDFTNLSRKLMELTPEPQFRPPRNSSSGVPRNHSSAEEEEREEEREEEEIPTPAEKSPVIPADPLTAMFEFATRDQRPQRPRGWEDASDSEFAVCKRVVDLWCAGKLPTGEWGDRIDLFCKGANALLGYHDGDLQACLLTLDRYHAQFDGGFTVSGPQSLVNVIPAFMGQQNGDGGPPGDGHGGRAGPGRHQRGHRREYEPCTNAERQAAWDIHGEWIQGFVARKREDLNWRIDPLQFRAEIGRRLGLDERQAQALCEAYVGWECETTEPLDVAAFFGEGS